MRYTWVIGCLLLAAGCGAESSDAPADPSAAFRDLEDRLVEARVARLAYHVTAEGAFEADLRGVLDVARDGATRLGATGTFGERPVDVVLVSDDGTVEIRGAGDPLDVPKPPSLEEALLIGFTRMGILHNLARLTGAALPDHADGGVREWVVADSFAVRAVDPLTTSFSLSVSGVRAGSAELDIDSEGRPVARRQVVRFPGSEMRVVERYSDVIIVP